MKTSDKDINRLTRKLLKEGMVEPSPDLGNRIMDLITKEAPLKVPEVKTAKIRSGMPPFMIVGIIIIYLLVFAGLLMVFSRQPAGHVSHMLQTLKENLPYALTIAAIAGLLIFYSALDRVLRLS